MQEHGKRLTNSNKRILFLEKKKINKQKLKLRIRKSFKTKACFINPIFQKIFNISKKSLFTRAINFRITPNNVFCTLKNTLNNKTLKTASSGKYKVKTSKKTLKFALKVIIDSFLNEINSEIGNEKILINLISPKKTRKSILKKIAPFFQKNALVINFSQKKCFNGCRPKKKKRKKQKGLRLFK